MDDWLQAFAAVWYLLDRASRELTGAPLWCLVASTIAAMLLVWIVMPAIDRYEDGEV